MTPEPQTAEQWFPKQLSELMEAVDLYAVVCAAHRADPQAVPAEHVQETRAELHAVMVSALIAGRRYSDVIPPKESQP